MPLNYTLDAHVENYNLSWGQAILLPLYSPYAGRHWSLAKSDPSHCWGHCFIAIMEGIPILGALASLLERIIVALRRCFYGDATPLVDPTIPAHNISHPAIPIAPVPSPIVLDVALKQQPSREMTIEALIKQVSKETRYENFQFKTNCTSIKDLKFIFLAEIHNDAIYRKFYSHVVCHLCRSGDTVFSEDNIGDMEAVNDQIILDLLPAKVAYLPWDLSNDKIRYVMPAIIKIGLICERIIDFVNKKHPDDESPCLINKSINDFVNSQQELLIYTHTQDIFKQLKKNQGEAGIFSCFQKINDLTDAVFKEVLLYGEKTLESRQQQMVQTLQNALNQANTQRFFICAGEKHIIQEGGTDIEDTLEKFISTSQSKYLIIFKNKDSVSQTSSKSVNSVEISDFRHLPNSYTLASISNLLHRKLKEGMAALTKIGHGSKISASG